MDIQASPPSPSSVSVKFPVGCREGDVEGAFSDPLTILQGDCRKIMKGMPDESVQMCVTSPPYWGLRDYGVAGQMGSEKTPEAFIRGMVRVFREVRRILKKDGVCWVNIGDSYNAHPGQRKVTDKAGAKQQTNAGSPRSASRNVAGMKPKDLVGIPWMLAFALRKDGWYLRQDIIWHKPNPMPESVTDRCTKAHEYLFLLTKSDRYFYDADAIKERSATNDPRRPYGSEGAWVMDGRSTEQRANGKLRTAGNKSHKYVSAYERSETEGHRTASGLMDVADVPWEHRNKRSVWTVASAPYKEAHFATYPPDLIKPCILAGSRPGDVVFDPFGGSGTTGEVSLELGRRAVLIELNPAYVALIHKRTTITPGLGI